MSSYAVGITGYAVLLVSLAALTIASRLPRSTIPTIGRMLASVRTTRLGRVLLVLGWAWVGWHLFVR